MANYRFNKGNLVIEDATGDDIIFRNFAGEERGRYNQKGNRNFCLIIRDGELARQLDTEGWNVRTTRARDEYEEPTYYIPVAVGYKYKPPMVRLIVPGTRPVNLTEDSVHQLDQVEISTVDLTIRPRRWEDDKTGESRVKAYLRSAYVTLEEDEFAAKYAEEEYPEDGEDIPLF